MMLHNEVVCPACEKTGEIYVYDEHGGEYIVRCPLCCGTGMFPPDPEDPNDEAVLRIIEMARNGEHDKAREVAVTMFIMMDALRRKSEEPWARIPETKGVLA